MAATTESAIDLSAITTKSERASIDRAEDNIVAQAVYTGLDDDVDVIHIATDEEKGDLMTKGLQRPKHEPAMHMVGLYPLIVVDSQ